MTRLWCSSFPNLVEVYETSGIYLLPREPDDLIIIWLDLGIRDLQLLECLPIEDVNWTALSYKSFHHYKIINGYSYDHWVVLFRIDGFEVAICEGYGWHPSLHSSVDKVHNLHTPQMLISCWRRGPLSIKTLDYGVDNHSNWDPPATSPPWGPRAVGSLPSLFVPWASLGTSPRALSPLASLWWKWSSALYKPSQVPNLY